MSDPAPTLRLTPASPRPHPGLSRSLMYLSTRSALRQLPRGLPRLPGTPDPRAARLPRPGARPERAPAGAPAAEGGRRYPRRREHCGLMRPTHALPVALPRALASRASLLPQPLAALVVLWPVPDPADCFWGLRKLLVTTAVSHQASAEHPQPGGSRGVCAPRGGLKARETQLEEIKGQALPHPHSLRVCWLEKGQVAAGVDEDPNPPGASGARPGPVPAALAANVPVPALVPEQRAGPGALLSQGQAPAVSGHCPSALLGPASSPTPLGKLWADRMARGALQARGPAAPLLGAPVQSLPSEGLDEPGLRAGSRGCFARWAWGGCTSPSSNLTWCVCQVCGRGGMSMRVPSAETVPRRGEQAQGMEQRKASRGVTTAG